VDWLMRSRRGGEGLGAAVPLLRVDSMTKRRVHGYPNEPVTPAVSTPTHRSAFGAAFLSFLFPGLGQAYAGAYVRAIVLAVPALVAIVVAIALFLANGALDFGLWIGQTSVLGPLAIVNVAILAYRAFASIDAYRLAVEPGMPADPALQAEPALPADPAMPAYPAGPAHPALRRIGRKPGQLDPLSIAGLAAILVVLVAGHVIVGYWDLKFYNLTKDVHTALVLDTSTPDVTLVPGSPEATVTYPPQQTFPPLPTIQPWTGTGRLNILLIGADIGGGGLTDTMIVASIDPVSHRVAMFSIQRDTVCLPLPARLAHFFPSWCSRPYPHLNEMYKDADRYKYPGGGPAALKQALGYYLFGSESAIQYYALVTFSGFQKVIDTLGGVTINVPAPLKDVSFSDVSTHLNVYIPAGIQHMNGSQALIYARSRKDLKSDGSESTLFNNLNRSARQQQILVALEQQANINDISAHLSDLVDALGQTVHTDIPEGPDVLGPMIQLAKSVKASDIRSYVLPLSPNITATRATVKAAFAPGSKATGDLQAAIDEIAPIIVENGTGISGQDTTVASFFQGIGLNALASASQPPQLGGPTRLLCINGADTQYPATLAVLEQTLGLTAAPSTDPSAAVQIVSEPNEAVGFVIITGADLPVLTVPAS
jgi:LCP family protein required for cell wall assembly